MIKSCFFGEKTSVWQNLLNVAVIFVYKIRLKKFYLKKSVVFEIRKRRNLFGSQRLERKDKTDCPVDKEFSSKRFERKESRISFGSNENRKRKINLLHGSILLKESKTKKSLKTPYFLNLSFIDLYEK